VRNIAKRRDPWFQTKKRCRGGVVKWAPEQKKKLKKRENRQKAFIPAEKRIEISRNTNLKKKRTLKRVRSGG